MGLWLRALAPIRKAVSDGENIVIQAAVEGFERCQTAQVTTVLNQEAVYRPCAPVETLEQPRQRGARFAIRTNLPARASATVFGIVASKTLAGSALPLERVRVGPVAFRNLLPRVHVRAVI